MSKLAKHGLPGVILGVIALVIALGGTSVALPGKNNVDANDYKKGSVSAYALAPIVKRTKTVSVAGGGSLADYGEGTAKCQTGEKAVAGGVSVNNTQIGQETPILESYRKKNGWYARFKNQTTPTAPLSFVVQVYCLSAPK